MHEQFPLPFQLGTGTGVSSEWLIPRRRRCICDQRLFRQIVTREISFAIDDTNDDCIYNSARVRVC